MMASGNDSCTRLRNTCQTCLVVDGLGRWRSSLVGALDELLAWSASFDSERQNCRTEAAVMFPDWCL